MLVCSLLMKIEKGWLVMYLIFNLKKKKKSKLAAADVFATFATHIPALIIMQLLRLCVEIICLLVRLLRKHSIHFTIKHSTNQ